MDEGEDHGLAPERVKRQVESSLKRLGVERVQMFLTHAPDPDVPIAETAGALDELVGAGKIGHYAVSNVDGAQLRDALAAGSFAWVQNSYSLLDREPEREVLPLWRGAWPRLHSVQPAWRAAGSRASTAATRTRPPARG
jgi:Predicted oxidoreductases (related to aryl-alcohol dehydrogenases)